MSNDGKVYGYGKGQSLSYVLFDQSKNKFWLKNVMFMEAFGQGFYDLSEIRDSLNPSVNQKIVEMLEGTLKFLHQKYMIVDDEGDQQFKNRYFWRIDAVDTTQAEEFKGELKLTDWPYLGQDVILMILALNNFDENLAKPYFDSLLKFSDFYMANRLTLTEEHSPHNPHHLFRLDHRILSLVDYAQKHKLAQFDKLATWVKKELPNVYSKIPKVDYSVNGKTTGSWSTQGVLEVYRLLAMKSSFQKFWKLSFDDVMKAKGIYAGHRILPMNFSSYPLYFNYAYEASQAGLLSEEHCQAVFKKMFLLYGNPDLLRSNLKYSQDLLPIDKDRSYWGNTPFAEYIEGVLPEGIYNNGSTQAQIQFFGNYRTNEFFPTERDYIKYDYNIDVGEFTAPFQYHYDRYSYGKAESYCLLNMTDDHFTTSLTDQAEQSFSMQVITPDMAKGYPVFGHLDISNLLYLEGNKDNSSGYEVIAVKFDGREIPFRTYQVLSFRERYYSKIDKAKLVFGLWSLGPKQTLNIEVHIKKRKTRQFFEGFSK